MSAASAWSYTSKATHWAVVSRDEWSGAYVYASPVVFDCDYIGGSKQMMDSTGVQFVSSMRLFTERGSINPGDMVIIGQSSASDPVDAGAARVRSVARYADTFDGLADDFEVAV